MNVPYDVVMVGAGIVGLATAKELRQRYPALKMAVLDKETAPGLHQSGHNSGVLHAGVYYKPGSLQAQLCVDGKSRMERFAAEAGAQQQPFAPPSTHSVVPVIQEPPAPAR